MNTKTFIKENFGVIITGIVSLAAVFVSIAQIWVASIDKEKELTISERNIEETRKLDETKAERAWNLDLANFMANHRKEIYSENEDRTQIEQIMIATFPPEITSKVFKNLSKVSSDEEQEIQWLKVSTDAKKLGIPRAKIFYDKNFPSQIFDAIPDSIGEGDIDYFVGNQIVPVGLTKGDIRYFRESDKKIAEQIKEDFKFLGCLEGYSINLTLIPLTENNIQNPGNYIEVWLSTNNIEKLSIGKKC